ncbi:MAG: two-component system, NarL family, sensor kinase, partial [Actinomycetota bacterium]|nr:two-component system, NarL family, sensor kinase [Actinomycetota bacterium]
MARFVGWFIVAGVVTLLIATAATAVAGHQAGEREAIVDLRAKTLSVALLRIQPVVTDSLLEGNITAVGFVSYAVRRHVIDDGVARVKIWNKDGTIVYSDESRLIGTHQPLRADQLAAISSARVRSKISDPSRPENRFERADGKLLEVDLRINAPNGQPLLAQVFYRYSAVSTAGTHVWNRFAPYALGALAALTVVLITTGCL